MHKDRYSYDFILILWAVGLMFLLSLLLLGSTFYFKLLGLGQLAPAQKGLYEGVLNRLAASLLGGILLVLALCIPRRFLPWKFLYYVALALGLLFITGWIIRDWRFALILVLLPTGALQLITLILLITGRKLHFHYEGFGKKFGSCFIHLGLVLLALSLLLIPYLGFKSALFWTAAFFLVSGLLCSYKEG